MSPPVYSAKMIDGRRAYDYAREGEQVEMRRSLINIYEMEILDYELPLVRVRVRCSKGTYIRSLAFEIGEALGSGAHLVGLRRTRSGEQRVEDAYTLEEVVGIMSLDPEKELAQMHNSEAHKGSGRKFLGVK